ncbi:MAG: SsrA-binding protein SmpB [Kiritimatiellae bacterium]|nr:SsrA-binding protein SmpB [Kiritimatiellia bacterium]
MARENAPSPKPGRQFLARNRKALHDFEVLEKIEAGIQLVGTEVKVVRDGKAGLAGAFAHIDKRTNEAFLDNVTIPPYDFGNRFNHDARRTRKLLMHRREILKLRAFVEQKGHTLVPLSLYMVHGRVKVEIGVCKGKAAHDKRETLLRRESDRDAERAIARHYRG